MTSTVPPLTSFRSTCGSTTKSTKVVSTTARAGEGEGRPAYWNSYKEGTFNFGELVQNWMENENCEDIRKFHDQIWNKGHYEEYIQIQYAYFARCVYDLAPLMYKEEWCAIYEELHDASGTLMGHLAFSARFVQFLRKLSHKLSTPSVVKGTDVILQAINAEIEATRLTMKYYPIQICMNELIISVQRSFS